MTNDDEWHCEIAATHQQHTALSTWVVVVVGWAVNKRSTSRFAVA